jgi:hypothetical protein
MLGIRFEEATPTKNNSADTAPLSAEPQLSSDVTFSVIVECDSEQQQAALCVRLEEEGYKCRLLIS